jgi:hypothetical protein
MDILEQLGVALGLASLAGVNLYLTVLMTGLAVRFDVLHLTEQYQALQALENPIVLAVAGVLFVMEFFADKIPWVDSLWDSVHTFIRPVGGVLLGLQAVGEVSPAMQVVAAMVAGGAALTTHGAKAGTRLLINHSPEPVTNIAMSVTEDVAVAGGVVLTLISPLIALVVFSTLLLLIWMLFPRLWRGIKATLWLAWNKLKMPGFRQSFSKPVDLPRQVDDELRDVVLIKAGIADEELLHTIPCLSGKGSGIRGLCSNLDGLLLVTKRPDVIYFLASKGLSDRLFKIALAGSSIEVESKFLSENLVISGTGLRAVFRLPRGQSEIVETLALRLREMLQTAQETVFSDPELEPETGTEMEIPVVSQAPVEVATAKPRESDSITPLPVVS